MDMPIAPVIDVPEIRAILARQGISYKTLARMAGLNYNYTTQVMRGGRTPGELSCYRIICAFRELGLKCPIKPLDTEAKSA